MPFVESHYETKKMLIISLKPYWREPVNSIKRKGGLQRLGKRKEENKERKLNCG